MSENFHNPTHEPGDEAEETLRLLAELREPDGLTDRVHRRLAHAQVMPERRGFWSLWMPMRRLQFAAAALLAVGVAGSTWSVYHSRPQATPKAQSAPPVIPAASHASAGSFGSANAVRVPPTLHPIKVPPAPKKKPGAGHVAAKAKTQAAQPEMAKPSANQ